MYRNLHLKTETFNLELNSDKILFLPCLITLPESFSILNKISSLKCLSLYHLKNLKSC